MTVPSAITRSQQLFERDAASFTQASLEAIHADATNCFVDVFDDDASTAAAATNFESQEPQSLRGVFFASKNNIEISGHVAVAGTHAFAGRSSGLESDVVTSLRKAGAVPIGFLNMHELALGTTSANAAFGFVRNPHDTSRSPGGSSGGSGAAVAAGLVPFALGTDTGGSCRIPAAYCGVVGYRPTTGRYSDAGLLGISPSRDTIGVLATSVEDIARVDASITGDIDLPKVDVSNVRIGLPRAGFFDLLSPEVADVTERAIATLRAEGFTVVETEVVGSHECRDIGFGIVGYEAPREILRAMNMPARDDEPMSETDRATLREFIHDVESPDVVETLSHFVENPVSEDSYQLALQGKRKLEDAFARAFSDDSLDVLIYPTVGIVAPVHGEDVVHVDGSEVPLFPFSIRNTDPGSIAGQPSLSIPIPRGEGDLPVGLGVEGKKGTDRETIAIAALILEILKNP